MVPKSVRQIFIFIAAIVLALLAAFALCSIGSEECAPDTPSIRFGTMLLGGCQPANQDYPSPAAIAVAPPYYRTRRRT